MKSKSFFYSDTVQKVYVLLDASSLSQILISRLQTRLIAITATNIRNISYEETKKEFLDVMEHLQEYCVEGRLTSKKSNIVDKC